MGRIKTVIVPSYMEAVIAAKKLRASERVEYGVFGAISREVDGEDFFLVSDVATLLTLAHLAAIETDSAFWH
jgi:hypothetical protein